MISNYSKQIKTTQTKKCLSWVRLHSIYYSRYKTFILEFSGVQALPSSKQVKSFLRPICQGAWKLSMLKNSKPNTTLYSGIKLVTKIAVCK